MSCHGRRGQQGLTLVEIMVALLIGLILIAGVIEVFLGTRQNYRFQEALARVQENGRYAIEIIGRDLRQGGYAGCATLETVTPSIVTVGPVFALGSFILGDDPALPAAAGTNSVTLRMLMPGGLPITADMPDVDGPIAIGPNAFSVGDVVAIADCASLDIFTVQGAGVAITPNNDLSRAYQQADRPTVTRFREVSYFLAPGPSGLNALWRRDSTVAGPDVALVDGVADLWLQYGEDTDGDGAPDVYRGGAAAVVRWDRVVSIRPALLLESMQDNVVDAPQTVFFRGVANVPGNRRVRQVMSTTIGFRNRLP